MEMWMMKTIVFGLIIGKINTKKFSKMKSKIIFLVLITILLFIIINSILSSNVIANSDVALLNFVPNNQNFQVNDIKVFDLNLNFKEGLPDEKINYLKIEVIFPRDYLAVPKGRYIDTSLSGFNRIVRVDGPTVSNDTGKIILELKAIPSESGPLISGEINLAKLYFLAKTATISERDITIEKVKLNTNLREIAVEPQNIKGVRFNIYGSGSVSNSETNRSIVIETPTPFKLELNYTSPTPEPKGILITINNIFSLFLCGLFKICN